LDWFLAPVVQKNQKMAKQAELEAKKEIDVTAAQTEKIAGEAQAQSQQAIGIAKAESMKKTGIAEQESISDIAKAERSTAEQQMEVVKINQIKQAEIDRERAIIAAEQEKQKMEIQAQADKFRVETEAAAILEAKRKEAEAVKTVGTAEAEVIMAKGVSEAESRKAMELAGVTAQTTLAKEIGENKPYQEYLIKIKEVEVSQVIGVAQYESIAKALAAADLKLLVNSGDVHSGIGKLTDLFTSKGASQLNGLIEGLKQTDEGKNLISMLNSITGGKTEPSSN
jgi:flotillin